MPRSRLCILKGIYPRIPPTAKEGANKIYYHVKDINFILRDPILKTLREEKTFAKKKVHIQAKRDPAAMRLLLERKPKMDLTHIVRERYPTFLDAVRDLDDALTMLALFAMLPSSVGGAAFTPQVSRQCQQLTDEFYRYVVETRSLRKVFVSIKGIYFQAEVLGQPVTWVTPFEFKIDTDAAHVDMLSMATFVEFYVVLLKHVRVGPRSIAASVGCSLLRACTCWGALLCCCYCFSCTCSCSCCAQVNFKLYKSIGLTYPPVIEADLRDNGAGLEALQLRTLSEAAHAVRQEAAEEDAAAMEATDHNDASGDDGDSDAGSEPSDGAAAMQTDSAATRRVEDLAHRLPAQPSAAASAAATASAATARETVALDEFVEDEDADADDAEAAHARKAAALEAKALEAKQNMFANLRFWLGRETPVRMLQFLIGSHGGIASWETNAAAPFAESDARITHHIIDRPLVTSSVAGRVYVQPQWLLDSVNAGICLPTDWYAPGAKLPPHVSPFDVYDESSYVPDQARLIARLRASVLGLPADGAAATAADGAAGAVGAAATEAVDADEAIGVAAAQYEQELAAEEAGIAYSAWSAMSEAERKARMLTGSKRRRGAATDDGDDDNNDGGSQEDQDEAPAPERRPDRDDQLSAMLLGSKQRRRYNNAVQEKAVAEAKAKRLADKKRQLKRQRVN